MKNVVCVGDGIEARRCPGSGVTCGCESSNVDSGNQSMVLCKSTNCLIIPCSLHIFVKTVFLTAPQPC